MIIFVSPIHTSQSFTSSCNKDQHQKAINMVRYCQNAHLYATASEDGSIKVWDGVSSRCIQDKILKINTRKQNTHKVFKNQTP